MRVVRADDALTKMTPADVQVDSILPRCWMLLTLLPQLLSNSFAGPTMCQALSTLTLRFCSGGTDRR